MSPIINHFKSLTSKQWSITSLLLPAAAIMIIIFGLHFTAPVMAPILFALTLTILLSPSLQFLLKRRIPKGIAVLILCLSIFVIFVVLVSFLSLSINQLITKLPDYQVMLVQNFVPITSLLEKYNIDYLTIIPSDWLTGESIARTTVSVAGVFIHNLYGLLFFFVTLVLMIAESDNVVKKFNRRFSLQHPLNVQFKNLSNIIQNQYKIQTLSNLLSATAATCVFLAFEIDFAVLWGVLIFVMAYIPNVGIVLASIPPIFLAFIQHGLTTALIVAGLITLLNLFMDNVIIPRFMGAGLHVPPVVVFISFIFWSWVFGLLGAFLALPTTLAIRGLLQENEKTKIVADILSSEEEIKKTKK